MLLPSRLLSLAILLSASACSHEPSAPASAAPSAPAAADSLVVEAACGTCMFDMPGSGCSLAVRIDGHAHYVDGAKLDDFGDAHAADGFCNAIRQARVSGRLEGERFVAAAFELLPDKQ
jgi:hypothetical protein